VYENLKAPFKFNGLVKFPTRDMERGKQNQMKAMKT